jgi:hypothetical protein
MFMFLSVQRKLICRNAFTDNSRKHKGKIIEMRKHNWTFYKDDVAIKHLKYFYICSKRRQNFIWKDEFLI